MRTCSRSAMSVCNWGCIVCISACHVDDEADASKRLLDGVRLPQNSECKFCMAFPSWLPVVYLLAILAAAPFFPESPRYFVAKGHLDDARQILSRCRLQPTESSLQHDVELPVNGA